MKRSIALSLVALALTTTGCIGEKSGWGFSLPDGDVAAGERAFVSLGCPSCHLVDGVDGLRPEGVDPELSIILGGETVRIATYGELVTSVINPSHRLSKTYREDVVAVDGVSKMRNYNSVMTVEELIDIVAFLQSHYTLPEYPETEYYPYR